MKSNNGLVTDRKTCRICGSTELESVIDLGSQYIASIFPKKGESSKSLLSPYPLELVRCSATDGCGLVQLKHTIKQQVLYQNYGYRSGINEIMRKNLRDIAGRVETLANLKPGDITLDIGCNDGTLLDSYQIKDLIKIGVDPAENVINDAVQKGFHIINDYFSYEVVSQALEGKKVKAVTSIAMFYDLEDPCKFVNDVSGILADNGIWVIELSYLPFMLEKLSYDTICHEHLEYYTLRQIEWMLKRSGLEVQEVEFNDINGGSFRLFIRKDAFGPLSSKNQKQLEQIRQKEKMLGLDGADAYQVFNEGATKNRQELIQLLTDLKASGKKIYIYGASTKGNTILQYCGIDTRLIDKAADRNPEKWGLNTPGTHIPIVSEEEARAERPDYFLVLPWHFMTGFMEREAAFLNHGGKFIVPLPEVQLIGHNHL